MFFTFDIYSQSPHGNSVKNDCADCHESSSWNIIASKIKFTHDQTNFKLLGQHKSISCRSCHQNLNFSNIKSECISCHLNIHKNSVSFDCSKCHSPQSWLVSNIKEIHQAGRFPLLGVHAKVDCKQCHSDFSNLNFEVLGINCIDCHSSDYNSTQNPNHAAGGFSKDCLSCHSLTSGRWNYLNVSHNFFPLNGGHSKISCFNCHKQNNFKGLTQDCYSCHSTNYNNTANPNHVSLQFGTDCKSCHSINGWKPASFEHDGQFFPIYSGEHKSNWNSCIDCHNVSGNYKNFTCLTSNCHPQNKMNQEHKDVSGYSYQSSSCLSCHPSGKKEGAFNHKNSNFPLTGAHLNAECTSCHLNGYAQKPPIDCFSCHKNNFNNTSKPNHITLNFSQDCNQCHDNISWKPAAKFNHTTTGFLLVGKHNISNCLKCHNDFFTNTSKTCFGCHENDFNNSVNPNHLAAKFPSTCEDCHDNSGWKPASFNHDGIYFPIYSGKHKDRWNSCRDCHSIQNQFNIFTCFGTCHDHNRNKMDNDHQTVNGFVYANYACLNCHPQGTNVGSVNHSTLRFTLTGAHLNVQCNSCHQSGFKNTPIECKYCHDEAFVNSQNPNHVQIGMSIECKNCHNSTAWIPSSFKHQNTSYQLTGAHINVNCSGCHIGQTTGTSQDCFYCHQSHYNQAANPNHKNLSPPIPNTCNDCHTTNPDWKPATFAIHNTYFVLQGKHSTIANDCFQCHNGNYTNTPNTCWGCHQTDFTNSTNPNHAAANFSHNCLDCHDQNIWTGAKFLNHDPQYFKIYSGKHKNRWNGCGDRCHPSQSNYANFTCFPCHSKSSMDNEHRNITNYQYTNSACYNCHRNVDILPKQMKNIFD